MIMHGAYAGGTIDYPALLPEGSVGIDAGLTLTKTVRAHAGRIDVSARETDTTSAADIASCDVVGVTGARSEQIASARAVRSQEIEAAARGVAALMHVDARPLADPWLLALLGTGTAFAAVRHEAGALKVTHLGGTALGGGSFVGIARRIDPSLTYDALLAAAGRGDRRNADTMVSDAYAEGIGRIGPDLTAAHLTKPGASLDDVMAALLNLHAENIAQIAASRAVVAQMRRIVLAGGFAHENGPLIEGIIAMAGMFGIAVDLAPHPGFAGAVGAALIAGDATGGTP
jgi:type II pantothenate kinase